jgi:hypothetical protein
MRCIMKCWTWPFFPRGASKFWNSSLRSEKITHIILFCRAMLVWWLPSYNLYAESYIERKLVRLGAHCSIFFTQPQRQHRELGSTMCYSINVIRNRFMWMNKLKKLNSVSELYPSSNHRLMAKLVSTFADRGCHVIRVTDPYCRILGFLDWSRYFFYQVAQLYSWGRVYPVPDLLLFRKSSTRPLDL